MLLECNKSFNGVGFGVGLERVVSANWIGGSRAPQSPNVNMFYNIELRSHFYFFYVTLYEEPKNFRI
jgi:hypothetical protein